MAFFDHNHTPNGTVDLLLETAPRHRNIFAEFEFWPFPCHALMP